MTRGEMVEEGLNLLTPGVLGREHGYDVPAGDEWNIRRIRLLRAGGRTEIADGIVADRIRFLEVDAHTSEAGRERLQAFKTAVGVE